MPGGCCGGSKAKYATNRAAFDPRKLTTTPNERNMFALDGDDAMCQPYHGKYTGSTLFLVGLGTDQEQLFRRADRDKAWQYAHQHKLPFAHISVISLCHERVSALLGA